MGKDVEEVVVLRACKSLGVHVGLASSNVNAQAKEDTTPLCLSSLLHSAESNGLTYSRNIDSGEGMDVLNVLRL